MKLKKLRLGNDTYELPEGVTNYNDLTNKPDLTVFATNQMVNNLSSDINRKLEGKADTTSIPSKTSELENDSDYTTNEALNTAKEALQGDIDSKVNTTTYNQKISQLESKISGESEEITERLDEHIGDSTHITADERTAWNGKATMAEVEAKGYATTVQLNNVKNDLQESIDGKADNKTLDSHVNNTDVHVTTTEKAGWNDKYTQAEIDASFGYYGERLEQHVGNNNIHVMSGEKAYWNGKADANNVYTKNEVETKLSVKANTEDVNAAIQAVEDKIPSKTEVWTYQTVSGELITREIYIK